MSVLVTGGAGFIGSHLVDALLADGDSVAVIDSFDGFYSRAIKERNIAAHRLNPHWRLVECDIRDLESLRRSLGDERIDTIVHLAAKAGVRPSIEDPVGYTDVNIRGTQTLLEFARLHGVRQFVFASSSSVYGVNAKVPWCEADHVLAPISPYAATKVAGELLGHVYASIHGIRVVALRFFTVYGPRQRPDLAIHKFASRMLAGQPIPLFGTGTTERDYTFIDDIVQGVRSAMRYRETPYEVINLGNSHTVSLLQMVEVLSGVLEVAPMIEWHPEQPGDVPRTWADVEKARALLGYVPRTPFAEGIARFAGWLRAQAAVEG